MNAVAITSHVLFALMIGFEAADKRIAPVQNCLDECLPREYRPGIKNYVGFQVLLLEIVKGFVLQSFWFCKRKIKSAFCILIYGGFETATASMQTKQAPANGFLCKSYKGLLSLYIYPHK